MTLSPIEQETILNYNEEEQEASVYTHHKALINKLHRLADQYPEACRLIKESHAGRAVEYTVPKRWIKVSPPRRSTMSAEQKKAAAERLMQARR